MEGVNPVHVDEGQGYKEVLRSAGSVRLDCPDCEEYQIWSLDAMEFSVKVSRNAMKRAKHHHSGKILKKLRKQAWSDFERTWSRRKKAKMPWLEMSKLLDELTEEQSLCDEMNACSDVITTLCSPRETSERKSAIDVIDSEEMTISAQRTRTQEFIDAAWVCKCLREDLGSHIFRHTHSRMILKQAGYSLRTFIGSRELFSAARDALQALDSAYKRCRRIHRDISLDNIILYRFESSGPRKGLLVDWEYSSVVDSSGRVADKSRTGTWAFMSGNALYGLKKFRHAIEDDLESLFYVVMYGSIRWLPHNYVSQLGRWVRSFFYEALPEGIGKTIGGTDKLLQIAFGGSEFLGTFSFENRFVQDWFRVGYKLLRTTSLASKDAGGKCLLTTESIQELFAVVCEGLARTDDTNIDRTEHELEGYAGATSRIQGTHISLFIAARNFRLIHTEPEFLEKRSSDEAFEDEDGIENDRSEVQVSPRRDKKRRRLVCQDNDDNNKKRKIQQDEYEQEWFGFGRFPPTRWTDSLFIQSRDEEKPTTQGKT
ncbi:hypothetical protein A7U60_g1313 [Sanghuangporus baumii]|uniref:Fungal-type protein kinase domain-containing protein n=1 Tax=Sanghuangporus baumii TaxID=108892 RepID=A0A9Q5I4A3_SANBA|nr:hypothetical protein A7U60_g1313 [Sanghuangporus baumii]